MKALGSMDEGVGSFILGGISHIPEGVDRDVASYPFPLIYWQARIEYGQERRRAVALVTTGKGVRMRVA